MSLAASLVSLAEAESAFQAQEGGKKAQQKKKKKKRKIVADREEAPAVALNLVPSPSRSGWQTEF